jgi:putative PIN family toxin of toxin-antitoxin system
MTPARKAVFDCNVFLPAMLRSAGASRACWDKAVSGEVELFVTRHILFEIRRLPEHRKLRQKFQNLTGLRVERFIEDLLEVARLVEDPPAVFLYARDPDDAHYVNLAIHSGALLVVSHDNDLLDLMSQTNPDGRALRAQYPDFRVYTPVQFLEQFRPVQES